MSHLAGEVRAGVYVSLAGGWFAAPPERIHPQGKEGSGGASGFADKLCTCLRKGSSFSILPHSLGEPSDSDCM